MGKTDFWDWFAKPLMVLGAYLTCALIFMLGYALLYAYDAVIDWWIED